MGYFLAPAGLTLWNEVRAKFPNRDSSSDGWIGDASHAARPSDHNPCYTCSGTSYGIVRAVDLDGDGWPAESCVQYLLARCRAGLEKRISYIIYKRRIWSVTYGWAQRYYSGINPHDAHFHVSLKRDYSNFQKQAFLPTFPFGSAAAPPPLQEEDEDMVIAFVVEYQSGIWLVASDLSSKTGFSSITDLNTVVTAGGGKGKYPTVNLSDGQMARIPVAGTSKVLP